MINLLNEIKSAIEEIGHGWTSVEKGHILAAQIITLQPEISVEIGVYAGKGLISMGLAHQFIGKGIVIGIDPYFSAASVEGQISADDQKFWSGLDHEAIYNMCQLNMERYGVSSRVQIIRKRSDDVEPPENIGLLRIDGNHGEQAARDFARYAPKVRVGGILHADDIDWAGGAISVAVNNLLNCGQFIQIMRLDDGVVLQRVK